MVYSKTLTPAQMAAIPEGQTLRFAFFRSIEAAGADWDAAAPPDNLFLQRSYLSIVEHQPPLGMRFGYVVFYRNNEPVGVSLCQIKHFNAESNIKVEEERENDPCFFTALSQWLKKRVASKVAADILISGNMLLSGEHGFWFKPGAVAEDEQIPLLESAWSEAIRLLEREGIRIPVMLVKDISDVNRAQGRALIQRSFVEFDIQPSMVMPLHYEDFDTYLESMSTKYRTRAKRAFKKGQGLEKRELTLLEIQREIPRLYHLYREIARNAGFNMVDLNEQYLLALKRDLGDHFRLFAYYLNGELVAFYTTIQNHGEMEAHFLGYEKELNHDLQLYLNILYDIIRIGIESGSNKLVFSRTALEIKSSVGAVPTHLYCYLRHQNPLTNHFTGTLLDYFKPVEQWQQRHPFKTGAEAVEEPAMD